MWEWERSEPVTSRGSSAPKTARLPASSHRRTGFVSGPSPTLSRYVDSTADPTSTPWRLALELGTVTLATSAALLLAGNVVNALGLNPARGSYSATVRFTLLGNAANPFIAAMALTAAVCAVALRPSPRTGSRSKVAGKVILATGVVGLVTAVLCLNGILLDFTTSGASGLVRLATILYRLGTLALSAGTLWIAFAASAKPRMEIGTAVTIERQPSEPAPLSTDNPPEKDPEGSGGDLAKQLDAEA